MVISKPLSKTIRHVLAKGLRRAHVLQKSETREFSHLFSSRERLLKHLILLIGCVRRRAAQKEQKSNFPISREDFSKRISTELFLFSNSIDGFGTEGIGVLLFMLQQ